MATREQRLRKELAGLNVVPGCRIFYTDDSTLRPRLKMIAEVAYTPRHIAGAIRDYERENPANYSYWVYAAGGRELWRLDPGAPLARKL